MSVEEEKDNMHRRRITLADGRYMIFYTFDEGPAPQSSDGKEADALRGREPHAIPQAEEERSV
ncbi:MAG TPA: hypothetical protein VE842_08300 [Pyrinomonadaceae bacterium]|jgi:hypothetical protein|nr:hypothetical protein [Pyrinomonadaceae bacterium]